MFNSNDVQRKSKCINVKFNDQFNADFVTMKNNGKHQWIFDESNHQSIYSDNLNLVEIINDKFATSENNSLGDCAKLLKFYLRQHSNTSDLLPSIVQNLLIVSHAASKSLGYIGQMTTTLSNITKKFNDKYENKKCLTFVLNPSNDEEIETNIDNISQMKDIILVIQDLEFDILHQVDISGGGLRALKLDSKIRSCEIYSSSQAKPWKE